jgi:GGDEF domain-containing protein
MLEYPAFVSALAQGRFGSLFVLDVGCLKGINSTFNLARGDMMLKDFLQKILLLFESKNIEDLDVSRKGSTFFVGVKNTTILETLTLSNLAKNIIGPGLEFTYNKQTIILPCGFSYTNIADQKNRSRITNITRHHFNESNKTISKKRLEADIYRTKSLCLYLLNDPDKLQNIIQRISERLQNISKNLDYFERGSWSELDFFVNELISETNINHSNTTEEAELEGKASTMSIRYVERCEKIILVLKNQFKGFQYNSRREVINNFISILEDSIFAMKHNT